MSSERNIIEWFFEHWKVIAFAIFIMAMVSIFIFSIYCAVIQPKEGIVIRKDYYPEYTSTEYNYITQTDGKSIRVPIQKYHAARYVITIKGVNSKGEEDNGVYDVTPVEYESIEIGDYYIKQKGE